MTTPPPPGAPEPSRDPHQWQPPPAQSSPHPHQWQPPPAAPPPAAPPPLQPSPQQPVPPPGPPWYQPPAVDPETGQPYSDKTRLAAGLLQLLPGFLVCIGGIGRLYAGRTGLGVTQLVLSISAWIGLVCLFWLIVPILFFFGMWLWSIVDGIVVLAGRTVDGHGRVLRP